MSEMTMDKIGKIELQVPREAGGDLEKAAQSAGGDAMAPSTQVTVDKNGTQIVTDHMEDRWSETYSEETAPNSKKYHDVTYQYSHRDATIDNHTVRINPDTGEKESLRASSDGKKQSASLFGGLYKLAKYKANPAPYKSKDVEDTPAFTDLVTKTKDGTLVKKLQGTLEQPNRENVLEKSIFINGTAYQDDIHQAYVGDCYFLAALLQVIHYDPSKIVSMMSLSGSEVSTRFYYKNGDKWSPTIIKTKLGYLYSDNSSAPRGSFARVSYDPKSTEWVASIDAKASLLKITRKDYYEAALWVNAMEQAFSLYAQTYGQYGEGKTEEMERYKLINGGYSGKCLHIFYGDQASDNSFKHTGTVDENTDAKSIAAINRNIIQELLLLAKNQDGPQKGKKLDDPENVDVHIMACTFGNITGSRLDTYSRIVSNELSTEIKSLEAQGANADQRKLANLKSAAETLEKVNGLAKDYFAAEDGQQRQEGSTNMTQDQIRDALDELSIKLEKNTDFMALNLASYDPMRALLGTVVEQKQKNIFIYSKHAYNLDHVSLVDKDNKDLKNESIDVVMERIDTKKSTVYIQNPHGCTRKNYHEKEERSQEGGYEVSLESLLAVTDYMTVATVSRKNENSK